jgi:hypothetical protein
VEVEEETIILIQEQMVVQVEEEEVLDHQPQGLEILHLLAHHKEILVEFQQVQVILEEEVAEPQQ